MLRILSASVTVAFLASIANAVDCDSAGGSDSCPSNTVAKASNGAGIACAASPCDNTDYDVCCTPDAGFWIAPDTGAVAAVTDVSACTGKTTAGGATDRKVDATATADASCTSCVAGTTFGPADGSEDCAPVTDVSACTGKTTTGGATDRKVDATATADATCTSCVAGTTFGAADGSEDCAPVSALAACTGKTTTGGATDRKVAGTATADATCTSCVAGTTFGLADGSEDCAAVTVCGQAVPGSDTTARATTTAGTATTDTVCADCAANTWAATGADACAAKSACGKAVPGEDGLRAEATAMTPTADTVCAACAAGTYAVGNGDCTACTVVDDSATGTALTCTSDTDSRVVACVSGKRKTVGVDAVAATTDPVVAATAGTADTCTTDCADGTFEASATACTRCTTDANAATGTTYTCSADDNARFSACKDGYYKDISGKSDVCIAHESCGKAVPGADDLRAITTAGTATANTVCAACAAGTYAVGNGDCTACTVVDDSATGTALTCTSATDSRVVACATDKVKHAGVDASDGVTATPDTCDTSVGCGNDIAGNTRTATTAKTDTADAVCPACVAGASETAGNCGCDAGTFKNADSTACTTCTAAASPVDNAMYTCTDDTAATEFTCADGFFKNAAGDACTACTAIANANSITCSSATSYTGAVCNDGFEPNSKSTYVNGVMTTLVCTACDAIANAAVTCTWPGNSVVASCDTGFDKADGACVAATTTTAASTTAPAPAPAAADAPATADAPSASLSAATSLVQSWSSIVVAAVMLVGIFQ